MLEQPLPFLPDAYFEFNLGQPGSLAFFVELDLATHPQAVWRGRARLYTAYADPEAGLFRRRFGRENFRLLVITTPDYRGRSRSQNILETMRSTVGPTDLFLVTTLDAIDDGHVLGRVWRQPGERLQRSILENVAARSPVVVRPVTRRARVQV